MAGYSALLLLAVALGAPWWLWGMAVNGRYRTGLAQRLGCVPADLRTAVAGKQTVWIHAVSVGEVLAAIRLIEELRRALPGAGIAVSTTTKTGQELAKKRLTGVPVFYMPLDFAWAVRRFIEALQPKLVVLMESELWPRLLVECERRGIPVAVVNARVSDRSFPRYMKLKRLWKPLLEKVSLFLAQSEETAHRLLRIGAPAERVRCVGNVKHDAGESGSHGMMRRIASLLQEARPLVAGSTAAGEETALLTAWPQIHNAMPETVLVIAPRHPQRFDEVAELIRATGYPFFRCSELLDATHPGEAIQGGSILLLDTIGDLAGMYSLAGVAFVGGSLVPQGGHNPLEPARYGVPVIMGHSYENFREMVKAMVEAKAIRLVKRDELADAVLSLWIGGHEMGARGRAFFEAETGATGRTVQALLHLLPEHRA